MTLSRTSSSFEIAVIIYPMERSLLNQRPPSFVPAAWRDGHWAPVKPLLADPAEKNPLQPWLNSQ